MRDPPRGLGRGVPCYSSELRGLAMVPLNSDPQADLQKNNGVCRTPV